MHTYIHTYIYIMKNEEKKYGNHINLHLIVIDLSRQSEAIIITYIVL